MSKPVFLSDKAVEALVKVKVHLVGFLIDAAFSQAVDQLLSIGFRKGAFQHGHGGSPADIFQAGIDHTDFGIASGDIIVQKVSVSIFTGAWVNVIAESVESEYQ